MSARSPQPSPLDQAINVGWHILGTSLKCRFSGSRSYRWDRRDDHAGNKPAQGLGNADRRASCATSMVGHWYVNIYTDANKVRGQLVKMQIRN